jgi:hypothetical protein
MEETTVVDFDVELLDNTTNNETTTETETTTTTTGMMIATKEDVRFPIITINDNKETIISDRAFNQPEGIINREGSTIEIQAQTMEDKDVSIKDVEIIMVDVLVDEIIKEVETLTVHNKMNSLLSMINPLITLFIHELRIK